jgi:hypothetical protein
VAGTGAPSGFDRIFVIVNVANCVSTLLVVTVTLVPPTIVTTPSFAVPDESVKVGVPNL